MHIVDFSKIANKNHWISEIQKCNWSSAKLLSKLLIENKFYEFLGYGTLYLLIEDNYLISFGTLTQKDCIEDDSMFPWIGYIYTQPQYRGHRYSQMIINKMLADATENGYLRVYLASEHIGLYEKYGFTYLENRIDIWGDINRIYVQNLE